MRTLLIGLVFSAQAAFASVPCGGSFGQFTSAMEAEAVRQGHSANAARAFFGAARQDPKVIKADRSQGVFQLGFIDFSRRVISQGRITNGR
ncbi:MAG: lytic murein transglycosylase, partial [Planctomycetota bacterium]